MKENNTSKGLSWLRLQFFMSRLIVFVLRRTYRFLKNDQKIVYAMAMIPIALTGQSRDDRVIAQAVRRDIAIHISTSNETWSNRTFLNVNRGRLPVGPNPHVIHRHFDSSGQS